MMSENELLLAYRDHISEDSVQQLLTLTELKMVQAGEERKLRKRVFSILVECLQNIVKHSENEGEEVSSILLLGRQRGEFFIVTGNQIANEEVPVLREKIDNINTVEHTEVRDTYSTMLEKSEYSAKGGAGLGLIDIYKRSGRKLEYNIDRVNDAVSFFSLKITVSNN